MRTFAVSHDETIITNDCTSHLPIKIFELGLQLLKAFPVPSADDHSTTSAKLDLKAGVIGFGRGDQTGEKKDLPWKPFMVIDLQGLQNWTVERVIRKVQIEQRFAR